MDRRDRVLTENDAAIPHDGGKVDAWADFKGAVWRHEINVRDFIQKNVTPYTGDSSFLSGPTERTKKLYAQVQKLMDEERAKGGVLDMDTKICSTIISHGPGYIDKDLEQIVGLQTDKPLKRAFMPYGGIRIAEKALKSYGYEVDPEVHDFFVKHRKTHNDGVFDVYTPAIRKARTAHILTGLPDGYGRGRIIGDYRRVALYGIDYLIKERQDVFHELDARIDEETIRTREELAEQIKALKELKQMAASYGCDISKPSVTAKEAIQAVYFAYLASVKEQNGAAMSFGRTSTFMDIYIERDMKRGILTEEEAQELIDHLVMKLRMVRFARAPEYNQLFSGDPTWVTESLGGIGIDGRPLVTKNSFRFLNTLTNLGPAPEPNLTVLWSPRLPQGWKNYAAKISAETSAIQYENDEQMREYWGDDYGIACCVSAMRIGKQMQFFGARANLAKCMLYAINGGKDELSGEQVGPELPLPKSDVLDYDDVMARFDKMMDYLAGIYMDSLNIIHYMHDKYCYERVLMALHDRDVYRTMATGIAGLSVAADSLSAIKYAKVTAIRDERGIVTDFKTEGEFPCYGNNDERVDSIAVDLVERFMKKLRNLKAYRGSTPTQSILTITSNVVYGKKTGTTPDGRQVGVPLAPGANPMSGRDKSGALASLTSVAKLPYEYAQDGISNTFSITPDTLGKTEEERSANLATMMDGYFTKKAHHLNVNVLNRETLLDAMDHPEKYPTLTIRVSGYAVNFIKLTREQQQDVVSRTFHERM